MAAPRSIAVSLAQCHVLKDRCVGPNPNAGSNNDSNRVFNSQARADAGAEHEVDSVEGEIDCVNQPC